MTAYVLKRKATAENRKTVIDNADACYVLRKKQYWKKVVTEVTKYWKETTTETTELAYACYRTVASSYGQFYAYAKAPIGSDMQDYVFGDYLQQASSPSDLKIGGMSYTSLSEESLVRYGANYSRYTAGDLYETVTTTTVVEGTPDDYTYTETETIESVVKGTKDNYDFTTDRAYVLRRK